MSRRVFASAVLLLLVVMMCCGTGAALAEVEQSSETKYQWKGISEGEGDVTVESLGAPSLLNVGSDVFAVAETQCKKKDGEHTFTGIASQLLTMDKGKEPKEVLNDVKDTQVMEEVTSSEERRVDVSRPTAVVDGGDIYILVGKNSHEAAAECKAETDKIKSGILLVKGEVGEGGNKQIHWKETGGVPCTLGDQQNSLKRLIGSGGSGVKMEGGTIVFPVEGTMKDGTEDDGKTVSLILCSSDTTSWTLSKGMSADGCGYPSVVEREKDKLMMMTACDDGRRRVYESGDKGNTWTEALGTLSRVWGSNQEGSEKLVRSGFTTAKIDGVDDKKVMLVTLPVHAKESQKEKEKGVLHLWLTDNTHIVDIGPVSGEDDAAASALLYKSSGIGTDGNNEELIALYEKKKGDRESSNSLFSVRLTEQLRRVKDVLATWKKVDEHVSNLCPSESAVKDAPTDTDCDVGKITDGLVGFLSGKFSDNVWRDEYLGVNATVNDNGATNTSDGVKFTGRGAGAEWPVGSQGVNQLYHFANYNFTLVATVSIDGEPKEADTSIPLMGAKINDDDKTPVLLGLSYDSGKKRAVLCGGGEDKELSSTWEPQTQYQVAIVLQNGTQGSAYVDGKRVWNAQCQLEGKEDKKISHFYIGGDGSNTEGQGGVSVTVTVTNVLLYNRPLDGNEIAGLAKNTINIPKPEVPKTPTKPPLSPEVSGLPVEGTVTQSNSAGQLLSEQEQPKGSNDAGAGGASTPATSTTATSSGKEPVNQQTSGTSPSGNKNVDVSSSSDADPAVVTGSGETVQGGGSLQTPGASASSVADAEAAGGTDGQGEEGIHPQDRELKAAALNSSLGNLSQGNNSDAGTVSGSGLLPSLLVLLGLWGFAAL
ncbi:trans-sialidase [Trypanosoma cruzi cruzi]|uniref:Putative trans-sialidase, Group VI n=1 Tax=Trypanosoma cruzi TaxID=5693 RepID=A0A2V2VWG6_TRYCR|nr:trans-sialidase [Trypanosoma cruzi cruzi]PWU99802.1 putative trans-sialidase, Group VI [Trypanosoma cruzi]